MQTLGLQKIPSCSTIRQRLNSLGAHKKEETTKQIMEESTKLLKKLEIPITPCFGEYVPLDADVCPFDNSNTKKEGVGWTYKKVMGYAPIFAYLGEEGYCVNAELRNGTQHCQKNTPAFLETAIDNARLITNAKILARLDSGNDAADNMALFQRRQVDFVIKRNPRKESIKAHFRRAEKRGTLIPGTREGKRIFVYEYYTKPKKCSNRVRVVSFVTERTSTITGQMLLIPEYELESYYTSLGRKTATSSQVQTLYHNHGTSEQFHSELKTDLDLERLPSGKFATNAIVLTLGVFTYNLLRIIGQESLQLKDYPPTTHEVNRRRIRTVIDRYISLGVKLVKHARNTYVKLSSFNLWLPSFKRIYEAFAT